MKYIKEQEIAHKIETIPNGMFFNITFRKKDGSLRTAVAQKGVHNTKDPNKAPKGTGESAKQALNAGRVKFYEPHHKNADGSITGEYRQAKVENILSFTHPSEKETYIIDRTHN